MNTRVNIKAQSTIEFTFAMVVIMFLVYGMVMIFRWGGLDLANRRVAQEKSLITMSGTSPASELDTDVGETVLPISAVYHGTLTNGYSN